MINSTNDISADISMNGQKFAEASSFKYRGAVQECTCSAEICIRIVFAKAAMARLNRIWFNIYKYFDTSIVLYGSETWTLLADQEKDVGFRYQAPEEISSRLLLWCKTNDCVQS